MALKNKFLLWCFLNHVSENIIAPGFRRIINHYGQALSNSLYFMYKKTASDHLNISQALSFWASFAGHSPF
ncbi:unnamed protein product [Blepharisma stoltei]|uniref:Uncharacterized protein n=1 Tax=Blepharisma stoltei TaxID=1481888 RepID=A0AAU9KB40_9CILI|nr:unnamed protein product [Blepharisma stoltei]